MSWDGLFGASKTIRVFIRISIFTVDICSIIVDIDAGAYNTRRTANGEITSRIEMKSDNGSICTGNIDISNIKMHLDIGIVITITANLKPGDMCSHAVATYTYSDLQPKHGRPRHEALGDSTYKAAMARSLRDTTKRQPTTHGRARQ